MPVLHYSVNMRFLVWVCLLITLIQNIHCEEQNIHHANLGYILSYVNNIRLTTNTASFTFAIRLPPLLERPTLAEFFCSDQLAANATATCNRFRPLIRRLTNLRFIMAQKLHASTSDIYSFLDVLSKNRQERSTSLVPEFLTNIFSSISGLDSTSDVDGMNNEVT